MEIKRNKLIPLYSVLKRDCGERRCGCSMLLQGTMPSGEGKRSGRIFLGMHECSCGFLSWRPARIPWTRSGGRAKQNGFWRERRVRRVRCRNNPTLEESSGWVCRQPRGRDLGSEQLSCSNEIGVILDVGVRRLRFGAWVVVHKHMADAAAINAALNTSLGCASRESRIPMETGGGLEFSGVCSGGAQPSTRLQG